MKKTKGKTDLLDTVPLRGVHVTTEWKNGYAVLVYPRFKRAWMRRFLLPKGMSPDIHVTLEEHGTAVWQLIDGHRTVREIIALLAGHFEGEAGYASRITTYILQLQKDGFIRLVIPTLC